MHCISSLLLPILVVILRAHCSTDDAERIISLLRGRHPTDEITVITSRPPTHLQKQPQKVHATPKLNTFIGDNDAGGENNDYDDDYDRRVQKKKSAHQEELRPPLLQEPDRPGAFRPDYRREPSKTGRAKGRQKMPVDYEKDYLAHKAKQLKRSRSLANLGKHPFGEAPAKGPRNRACNQPHGCDDLDAHQYGRNAYPRYDMLGRQHKKDHHHDQNGHHKKSSVTKPSTTGKNGKTEPTREEKEMMHERQSTPEVLSYIPMPLLFPYNSSPSMSPLGSGSSDRLGEEQQQQANMDELASETTFRVFPVPDPELVGLRSTVEEAACQ